MRVKSYQTVHVAGICALFLMSCLNPFAPELEQSPDVNLLITEQKSVDDVLQNFKLAYFFRDSLLYSELLDSSFSFIYFDPNIETSGRFVSWGRDTDLRTTGRLFREFDGINLVWESTVFSDTLEWQSGNGAPIKIENINRFSLKLSSTESGFDFNLWGKAHFTFIHCAYDDKWRIMRWKDESYY
ncbi:hypothetical protein JXJ21_10045 [candidate division KSB1 bacterium]|nr:hypothetical protein [candidate division KSB1 bacterium]